MELCRAASFSSCRGAFSVPPSVHYPRQIQAGRAKRLKIWCLSMEDDAPEKTKQMVVSITGATGFIGKRLVQRLREDNHSVRILTRSRAKAHLIFSAKDPEIVLVEEVNWKDAIQGSTAVVNLAGMPISTRWSQEIKKEIKDSRIRVTSKVVDIINQLQPTVRPAVLVSATAIGYYGTSERAVFDETSPSGNDFLAEVCREWEASALKVDKDVRVACIRIGVVLGKDGGALAKMIPIFTMFAGGPLGSGKQCNRSLQGTIWAGVINGTSPNPVRLADMCSELGGIMGRPSWLPVPGFALKAVLGEGACVVLEGQKVLPARAKELGFVFKYPDVKDALRAILS